MTRAVRRASGLAAVGVAAAVAIALRRRRPGRRERVDLYYDDGEVVTLAPSAPEAERLLAIARNALAAARS